MGLLTDDCDENTNTLQMQLGGNGDYYITVFSNRAHTVRISTHGGNAPTDVKIAVANLYREMVKHGLV